MSSYSITKLTDAREGGAVKFRIRRSGNTTGTGSVRFFTQSRTATAGSDFIGVDQRIRFTAGQTFRNISVATLVDSLNESTESFTGKLSRIRKSDVISKRSARAWITNIATTPTPTSAPSGDDFAASTSTTGNINVGGNVSGVVNSSGDLDWFRIALTAGRSYRFNLNGNTLSDPVLALLNASGSQLAFNDDYNGNNSQITFTASSSGTYYLNAGGYGSGTGSYTLLAADTSPTPTPTPAPSDLGDILKMQSAPVLTQDGPSPTGNILFDGSYYSKLDFTTDGEIEFNGEIDYYKLEVDPGNVVSLYVDSISGVYPQLSVVNSSGALVRNKEGTYGDDHAALGPLDIITGQTDLYVKVQYSQSMGSYVLSHEIYESRGALTDKIFELTNVERAKLGIPTLTRDPILNHAAYVHSKDMVDNNYFSHSGINGSSPTDRAAAAGYANRVGENIAGHFNGAFKAVEAWMNSSGHRSNILNSNYAELGVGYYHASSGATYTQMFGTSWLI